jgi:hypothetical protein
MLNPMVKHSCAPAGGGMAHHICWRTIWPHRRALNKGVRIPSLALIDALLLDSVPCPGTAAPRRKPRPIPTMSDGKGWRRINSANPPGSSGR